MEPLHLKSEEALYGYLKKFLKERPNAVQLDGSSKAAPNSKVVVVFCFSIDGLKYKLLGETTRQAIETFVQLTEENGGAGIVLKEAKDSNRGGLFLANKSDYEG